ncbi:very short patch repair endonuclease [Brevundimonas sp. SL161]|uniref:very short patch repair endonuclease n=1 Tax=Brevundimonas sp. SL161 TaxID=2804613 RepID=UPI003CE68B22
MTDVFSSEKRSAVMRRVKGRDTAPEIAVRRMLRAAGVGYRLGGSGLPDKPDIVMQGRRTVVFVHGCFWHGHDCARGSRKPRANAGYWTAKLARNVARDRQVAAKLTNDGWHVVTVWECGLKAPDAASKLLAEVTGQAATVSASLASGSSPSRT